jgi:hypothetical protein
MPDEVGDEFEAPLKRYEAEFGLLGVTATPLLGSESAGGGGSWNANDRAGRSSQSQWGKSQEGIEGGEDRSHNFKRALYVAQFALPMPPRGRQRKGVD